MKKELQNQKNNVVLEKDERLDDLQYNGLKIVQNKKLYCFSSDAVLLCNFIKAKKTDIIVDFCSGSGVVGILAQAKTGAYKLIMIEKQKELFNMCKKTIVLNGLTEKIQVFNDDVKNAPKVLGLDKYDVVCANPPYYLPSQKKMSENKIIDTAKFETDLSFDDLCKSASRILKYGGKFFLINDSERVAELVTTLKKYSLEPKVLEFVFPNKKLDHNQKTFSSNVVLIEAVKNGKSGARVYYKIID